MLPVQITVGAGMPAGASDALRMPGSVRDFKGLSARSVPGSNGGRVRGWQAIPSRGLAFALVPAVLLAGCLAGSGEGVALRDAYAATMRAASLNLPCALSTAEWMAPRPLPFGNARDLGASPRRLSSAYRHVVAMAADPKGRGYWLVSARGRVVGYGDARFHGSAAVSGSDRVVGIVASGDGEGYWVVSRAGRVSAFGDAHFHGELHGRHRLGPIVAMTATPDARGYWLVGSDGRVWRFGDARFYGSAPDERERTDIVSMVSSFDGRGYWLAAASGGILRFGDARYFGSAISEHAHEYVVGMAATRDGRGYWLVAANGHVLNFGDARYYGSARPSGRGNSIGSITAVPSGHGYWLLPASRASPDGLRPPGKGYVACRVTAIGDSVMLDVEPVLQAEIPGIDVEAAVSRQWDAGVALAQQLKSEGTLGALVVVDLGTNGPVSAEQFKSMMDVLAGASRVVFVTVHLPSSFSWSASVNATLKQSVAQYPQAVLADFNRLADENPQWFGADGVHMPIGGSGAQAMAALIRAEL